METSTPSIDPVQLILEILEKEIACYQGELERRLLYGHNIPWFPTKEARKRLHNSRPARIRYTNQLKLPTGIRDLKAKFWYLPKYKGTEKLTEVILRKDDVVIKLSDDERKKENGFKYELLLSKIMVTFGMTCGIDIKTLNGEEVRVEGKKETDIDILAFDPESCRVVAVSVKNELDIISLYDVDDHLEICKNHKLTPVLIAKDTYRNVRTEFEKLNGWVIETRKQYNFSVKGFTEQDFKEVKKIFGYKFMEFIKKRVPSDLKSLIKEEFVQKMRKALKK
jgi:hypothetical protein